MVKSKSKSRPRTKKRTAKAEVVPQEQVSAFSSGYSRGVAATKRHLTSAVSSLGAACRSLIARVDCRRVTIANTATVRRVRQQGRSVLELATGAAVVVFGWTVTIAAGGTMVLIGLGAVVTIMAGATALWGAALIAELYDGAVTSVDKLLAASRRVAGKSWRSGDVAVAMA